MKYLIINLVFIIIFISGNINGQVVYQDARGNSTLLFQGGTFGIDITEASLNLGYNNLKNLPEDKNKIIWGFNVQVKNEKGLGNLIKNGQLQPNSKAEIYFGYRIFDTKLKNNKARDKIVMDLQKKENEEKNQIEHELREIIKDFLENNKKSLQREIALIKIENKNDSLIKILVNKITELKNVEQDLMKISNYGFKDFNELYIFSLDKVGKDLEIKNRYDTILSLKSKYEEVSNKYSKEKVAIMGNQPKDTGLQDEDEKEVKEKTDQKKKCKTIKELIDKNWISATKNWSYFVNGGLNAAKYDIYNFIDDKNLYNNIIEENFNGYYFNVGTNLEVNNCQFGLTFGWQQSNNAIYLDSKEFTIRETLSSQTQPLQQSQQKTYNALEGNYFSDTEFTIKLDFLKRYLIKDKNKLAINPYYRLYSGSDLPDLNQLGIGAYLFNPKETVIMGVYIENYDLTKSIYYTYGGDNKPKFSNTLNIGIVTKFALSAIISPPKNLKALKDKS